MDAEKWSINNVVDHLLGQNDYFCIVRQPFDLKRQGNSIFIL